MMLKMPPWPSPLTDGMNRTTYIQKSVAVNKDANGDTVVILFGNGEYGIGAVPPCTSRQESCVTTTAASSANPFVFASETQGRTSCDPSCSILVPTAPNRVTYYRVSHLDGATSDGVLVDTFQSSTPPPPPPKPKPPKMRDAKPGDAARLSQMIRDDLGHEVTEKQVRKNLDALLKI